MKKYSNITQEERDALYDIAIKIWNEYISDVKDEIDTSEWDSRFNKYIKGIWAAAADLPTIPKSAKKKK
jgi:hypothetical protein